MVLIYCYTNTSHDNFSITCIIIATHVWENYNNLTTDKKQNSFMSEFVSGDGTVSLTRHMHGVMCYMITHVNKCLY